MVNEMSNTLEQPFIACHDCDLLYQKQPLREGGRANCVRCGGLLYCKKRDSLNRTLTLTLTSLILFVLANAYPFMTFEISGRVQESHLITGVFELYDQGFVGLSLVVLGASIVFPLMKILGLLYVLLPLRLHRQLWQAPLVFKYIELVTPWAMMEVYMLGVFVAYVKLIDMATIVLGTALYAFTALIVVLAAAGSTLDPDEVWKKLETTR